MKKQTKSLTSHVDGKLHYLEVRSIKNKTGETIATNRTGFINIIDGRERSVARYSIPAGCKLLIANGEKVKKGEEFASWDPRKKVIISEVSGTAQFLDKAIKGEKPSHITIIDGNSKLVAGYFIPPDAEVQVKEGQRVEVGDELASIKLELELEKKAKGNENQEMSI